jgi:hypothetical protein
MNSPRTPILIAAAVVVAVLLGWAVVGASGGAEAASDLEGVGPGAALSGPERAELAGTPIQAGDATPVTDPAVVFTDPEAVARAYLVAAHSHAAADAGRTNRRGMPYAVAGGPDGGVGIVVLDAPPPGQVSVAAVEDLALFASSPEGDRLGYRAAYRVAMGPPGALGPPGPVRTRYLVLVRQADGRWLVAVDTTDPPTGEN